MADDLTRLAKKLESFAHLLSPEQVQEMLGRVGQQMKPEVQAGVERTPANRGSLRDGSMSGWGKRDGSPFVLTGRYTQPSWNVLEIVPARTAIGPIRVLEAGRSAYQAGDTRVKGTYTSKKTGQVRTRTRKVKRNVGATKPKGTWSDVAGVVDKKAPAAFAAERVKAIGKILSRG